MIFVDTSALFSLAVERDRDHKRAHECMLRLQSENKRLWTGLHVVQEFWFLVASRSGRDQADSTLTYIFDSGTQLQEFHAHDVRSALALSNRYPDQDFSITDRISFSLLERLDRNNVWTYDHDFAVYRYGPDHLSSFVIVQ